MDLKRVVVTGLGALTPIGNTVEELRKALFEGISGADTITRFDPSNFKTKFACELKNYDPLDFFDRKEARRLDPYAQYALVTSAEAVKDAGLDPKEIDVDRVGVIMSSGLKTGDQAGNVDETGVSYVVAWSSVSNAASPAVPTNSFAIAGDFRQGAVKLNWNTKIQAYAREVFTDVVNEVSDGGASGTTYSVNFTPLDGYDPTTGAAGTANTDGYSLVCSDPAHAICFDQILISQ